MAVQIPTAVFEAFMVLISLMSVILFPMFVNRIEKFPIAQRLPTVVCLTLILLSANAYTFIIPAIFSSSLLMDCQNFTVWSTILFESINLLLGVRVTWLFIKDFSMKLMIKNNLRRRGSQSVSKAELEIIEDRPANIIFRLSYSVLTFLLKRFNVFQTVWIVSGPAMIPGVLDLIFVFVKMNGKGVPLFSQECFDIGFQLSMQFKSAVGLMMCTLAVVGFAMVRTIQERLSISKEIKALIPPAFATEIVMAYVASAEGFQMMMLESKWFNFLAGCISCVAIFLVQSLYPIVLSIQHEKDQEIFKATRKLRRLNYSKIKMSNLKTNLKYSEVESEKSSVVAPPDPLKDFENTLQNEKLRNLYFDFLTQELDVENLIFYEACVRYKNMSSYDDARRTEAQWIFDLYISKSSGSSVRLSRRIRQQISDIFNALDRIRATEAAFVVDFPQDIFDDAKNEVANLMLEDSFQRFKMTQGYVQFLEENEQFR
jgi:hypothetical protein